MFSQSLFFVCFCSNQVGPLKTFIFAYSSAVVSITQNKTKVLITLQPCVLDPTISLTPNLSSSLSLSTAFYLYQHFSSLWYIIVYKLEYFLTVSILVVLAYDATATYPPLGANIFSSTIILAISQDFFVYRGVVCSLACFLLGRVM